MATWDDGSTTWNDLVATWDETGTTAVAGGTRTVTVTVTGTAAVAHAGGGTRSVTVTTDGDAAVATPDNGSGNRTVTVTITGTAAVVVGASGTLAATVTITGTAADEYGDPVVDDPPTRDDDLETARRPAVTTSYRFISCDLKTGTRQGVLPLVPQGAIVRGMLAVETMTFTVPVGDPRLPFDWADLVEPGRTLIVCDRIPDRTIIQGWVVTGLPTRGSGGVTLQTATLEAYLDRRTVKDHIAEWYQEDAATVVAEGLIDDANDDGIGFVPDTAASIVVARQYAATERQSVLDALTELTQAEDGPEMMIDLAWSDDQATVDKTIRAMPRVGVVNPAGRVRFVAGPVGSVVVYNDVLDYTAETGANSVVATTEGMMSTEEQDADLLTAGWPVWEATTDHPNLVENPAVAGDLEAALQGYARRDLKRMRAGSHAYSFTATAELAPQVRTDFDVGDDVTLVVQPGSPAHPRGLQVTARCSSWQLDLSAGTLTPVLVDDTAVAIELDDPNPPIDPPDEPPIEVLNGSGTCAVTVTITGAAVATAALAGTGNRTVVVTITGTATVVGNAYGSASPYGAGTPYGGSFGFGSEPFGQSPFGGN